MMCPAGIVEPFIPEMLMTDSGKSEYVIPFESRYEIP